MEVGKFIEIGRIMGEVNHWTGMIGRITEVHPQHPKSSYTVEVKVEGKVKKILLFDGEFSEVKNDSMLNH